MFDWIKKTFAKNDPQPETKPSGTKRFRAAISNDREDAASVAQYQFVEYTFSEGTELLELLKKENNLAFSGTIRVLEKLLLLLRETRDKTGNAVSGFTSDDISKLTILGDQEKPRLTDQFPVDEKNAANLLRHFCWLRIPGIKFHLLDKEFALPGVDLRTIHGGCAVKINSRDHMGGGL
jgi:hypothetical protein